MTNVFDFLNSIKTNNTLTNNDKVFYPGIYPRYLQKQIFITPYRGRPTSLRLFNERVISYIRENTKLQSIFITIEQDEDHDFNLGYLVNCAYSWYKDTLNQSSHVNDMMWMYPVDVYPININLHVQDNAIYSDAAGKIIGTKCNIFEMVNGFPNNYFGYGMEDHDIFARCTMYGIPRLYLQGEYEMPNIPEGDAQSEKGKFEERNKNMFYDNIHNNNGEGLRNINFKLKKTTKYDNNHYHITVKLYK